MRAMILRQAGDRVGPGASILEPADIPIPACGNGDVLIRVSVCGVCRTDLDLVDGRIIAPRYPVIPGHQIVGHVVATGAGAVSHREGDRVGVAWIHWACGECQWCQRGLENLCPRFQSTGCDANGGYAEYVVAPAAFTYAIPAVFGDAEAAPLLCAGAIGWRSLRLTNLHDGEPLGLTGFGSSAHLVLQLARQQYPASPIYVFARSAGERAFALTLGAAWAGDTTDHPPERLAAIIDTTPAWKPVVEALPRLRPGGRLVINAIRKASGDRQELERLNYASDLWMEREIKTVANVTRVDVRAMLAAMAASGSRPTVKTMPLERANEALEALRSAGEIRGATVLTVT